MNKTYKFRLNPTKQQEQKFIEFAGQCRFVYNELLSRSIKAFKNKDDFNLTPFGLNYIIQDLKKEFEWLKECDSQALQQSAKNLSTAYKNFFRKCKQKTKGKKGFPKFKSVHNSPRAFGYPQRVKTKDNKIFLPKIGWVTFKKSQEIQGKIKNATVKQTPTGEWNVTICVELNAKQQFDMKLPKKNNVIGIDVGLSTYVTLSDGAKIDPLKPFKKQQSKLKRKQQDLSRKQKGSKNRAKSKQIVAKLHEKIKHQRNDFQHKLSSRLVNENQVIGIEDLNIVSMMSKNGKKKLGKAFSDAGLGEFLRQLEYKCEWYGRSLVKADKYFPSSKMCSNCSALTDLRLSDRSWKCDCGVKHDRDINAAINLMKNAAINLKQFAAGHAEK